MSYLFVYGTLKQGHKNHELLKQQLYVAKAQTYLNYLMYPSTFYEYPFLVKAGGELKVAGEIYEVDDRFLNTTVDRFEGVDQGLYQRVMIELVDDVENIIHAYTYVAGEGVDESCFWSSTPIGEWKIVYEKLGSRLIKVL